MADARPGVSSDGLRRRIVIVDDDVLLRGLLETQLTQWGFEVRQTDSAAAAVSLCKEFDPDGVILDVDLGAGLNGFHLAEALVRHLPHVGIVFLTRFPDARSSIAQLSPALRDAAYVNKGTVEKSVDLLDALNAALTGRGRSIRHDQRTNRPLAKLTRGQLDVMRLIHEGKTNAQIADARETTVSAAEKMVGRLYAVLGVDVHAVNARAIVAGMFGEIYGSGSPTSGPRD